MDLFDGATSKPPGQLNIEDPTKAGEIKGVLTGYVGNDGSGWDVYIPGRAFFARTGQDGAFTLNYVPPVDWTIVISNVGRQTL